MFEHKLGLISLVFFPENCTLAGRKRRKETRGVGRANFNARLKTLYSFNRQPVNKNKLSNCV